MEVRICMEIKITNKKMGPEAVEYLHIVDACISHSLALA